MLFALSFYLIFARLLLIILLVEWLGLARKLSVAGIFIVRARFFARLLCFVDVVVRYDFVALVGSGSVR